MWLIHTAMRRPITILIAVISIALCSIVALKRMPVDIFPNLNLPVIYVAQPYGGMTPEQMEGYLVSYYEYHFLYITGIEHVESKSIQNVGLIKLYFHPGTDMSQSLAQTISYVERSRAFMPPGTVPPFVVRFDAGSVPVGQLVFSSTSHSVGEIQDMVLFRVRPMFATLPGVSAPPPFGASQRTIVIRVDPDRLREYNTAPEEVIKAIANANAITPSGNIGIGDMNRIVRLNSVVSNINELGGIPIRTGAGPAVFLRDLGSIQDSSDILTGYALVNGHRTVYIPVTKRATASTLDVVNEVKANLPKMQSLLPDDIKMSFEFDQSIYVKNAIRGLVIEGILGAILTCLMVLFFLQDLKSALIVLINIPLALLTALVCLWLAGQTVNIMTLGGLALAIGILVDESTVAIENIHTHLIRGEPIARAVLEAGRETLTPLFLAMLSVLAVFVPSFFMVGITRALFVPLSLALGFAMLASYLLSLTLVPVLSTWLLRTHSTMAGDESSFHRFRENYRKLLRHVLPFRVGMVAGYILLTTIGILLIKPWLGSDLFPKVDTGQFQLRLRAPTGTRVERTEIVALKAIDIISQEAGPENVAITLGFVGTQPPNYPINTIYLWTSGSHEAVLLVALKPTAHIRLNDFEERLRQKLSAALPDVLLSFEAGDIVSQITNLGSPTPVEIAVSGRNLDANREFAAKIMDEMRRIRTLRDLQFGQPLDYPTVDVTLDRERTGQLGVTVTDVGRSLAAATSSSRYVQPNFWLEPASGVAYQVQVEIPQHQMRSVEDVGYVPVSPYRASHPLVSDIATLGQKKMLGEYDRYNMQRMITITANISKKDLGSTAHQILAALQRAGQPPPKVTVNVRGQIPLLHDTLSGLQRGLLLAIVVVFLLMAANFESMRLAFLVFTTAPAVILGAEMALWITGTTLNIQSFMGAIMAIGVSVANAILLVTFAEKHRRAGLNAEDAAVEGAASRLRPILMTSLAMIAGMIPMALALGEGGEQTAPLGRALIGGLFASTLVVLTVLPCVFSLVQRKASLASASLHPDDVQ